MEPDQNIPKFMLFPKKQIFIVCLITVVAIIILPIITGRISGYLVDKTFKENSESLSKMQKVFSMPDPEPDRSLDRVYSDSVMDVVCNNERKIYVETLFKFSIECLPSFQVVENSSSIGTDLLEFRTMDGVKYVGIMATQENGNVQGRLDYEKSIFTPSSAEIEYKSAYTERQINGIPSLFYESGYTGSSSYRTNKGGSLMVMMFLDDVTLTFTYASSDGVVDGKITNSTDGLDNILRSVKKSGGSQYFDESGGGISNRYRCEKIVKDGFEARFPLDNVLVYLCHVGTADNTDYDYYKFLYTGKGIYESPAINGIAFKISVPDGYYINDIKMPSETIINQYDKSSLNGTETREGNTITVDNAIKAYGFPAKMRLSDDEHQTFNEFLIGKKYGDIKKFGEFGAIIDRGEVDSMWIYVGPGKSWLIYFSVPNFIWNSLDIFKVE